MNSKTKSLLKDTMIFALGSLGSKVILFFLVPLYTNYLSTEEYGIADLVSTFASLIIPISCLTINSAVIRFGMKKDENAENVLRTAFVVLVFSILVTIILYPFLGFYKTIKELRLYLSVQVILYNFTEVEKTYLKVKNKNKLFSIISILQTAVLALSNLVLLTVMHLGVRGYLIANIAAASIGTVVPLITGNIWKDLIRGHFDSSLLRRMVYYSCPLIFSNISWWVVHSSDKIMIECLITASSLGIYTAATKIPSLINVIIAIFNQAWGISSIKEVEENNDNSFMSSVINLFCSVLFGACLVFIIIIKPFMSIYVGKDFSEAWIYTPFLLVAAVLFSVSALIGSLYSAIEKTKNDMWTTILCAIINVIVNYLGIKLLGVWGAVLGTVVAYFVCASIRVVDIKKLLRIDIVKKYFYNIILLLSLSMIISFQIKPFVFSIAFVILYVALNINELKFLITKTIKMINIR